MRPSSGRPGSTVVVTLVALLAGCSGEGASPPAPRAAAATVVGGQALCLLITLLVTPVIYSLFDDLRGSGVWGLLRPSRWGGVALERTRLAGSRRGP